MIKLFEFRNQDLGKGKTTTPYTFYGYDKQLSKSSLGRLGPFIATYFDAGPKRSSNWLIWYLPEGINTLKQIEQLPASWYKQIWNKLLAVAAKKAGEHAIAGASKSLIQEGTQRGRHELYGKKINLIISGASLKGKLKPIGGDLDLPNEVQKAEKPSKAYNVNDMFGNISAKDVITNPLDIAKSVKKAAPAAAADAEKAINSIKDAAKSGNVEGVAKVVEKVTEGTVSEQDLKDMSSGKIPDSLNTMVKDINKDIDKDPIKKEALEIVKSKKSFLQKVFSKIKTIFKEHKALVVLIGSLIIAGLAIVVYVKLKSKKNTKAAESVLDSFCSINDSAFLEDTSSDIAKMLLALGAMGLIAKSLKGLFSKESSGADRARWGATLLITLAAVLGSAAA